MKISPTWRKERKSKTGIVMRWTRLELSVTEQDRQRTYNVQLRRVRVTFVAVEKQWVSHNLSVCIYSLRYPACNAHAPYCHLWPARLYNIFPLYLINSTIFEKFIEHKMYVLIFSTTFVRNFFVLRRNERDTIAKVYRCRYSALYCGLILVNWVHSTDFRKIHKYKISWKFLIVE